LFFGKLTESNLAIRKQKKKVEKQKTKKHTIVASNVELTIIFFVFTLKVFRIVVSLRQKTASGSLEIVQTMKIVYLLLSGILYNTPWSWKIVVKAILNCLSSNL